MDARKIVVVVEGVDVARTALQWALHNILRFGDLITLLHVYTTTTSKSKKKLRHFRFKGFQLVLSFRETCNPLLNVEVFGELRPAIRVACDLKNFPLIHLRRKICSLQLEGDLSQETIILINRAKEVD
ncbi:unnamed protein product [Fraxinus pennsylvanica]|uniref:UspA domain-containing protein n=1 Tax=Fraxinus pennsylvanica TaxID=56036 RepID=A0AAD1ZXF6_9LAMI|nr:unnamed protein product [Fraxinus pennsylvanica]